MLDHAHCFKDDVDVVTAALHNNPRSFQYVSMQLKEDYTIVALAVSLDGENLE